MRFLTKSLLLLNGLLLAFIVLWLLVGGSNRGYFGGGGASEVDGILLMVLALFNVVFLITVFIAVSPGARRAAGQEAVDVVGRNPLEDDTTLRRVLRSWCQWALLINGLLILFTGLWLLVNTDRWRYFSGNATQVDMILLFVLSILNIAYMGVTYIRFSMSAKRANPQSGTIP